MDISKKTNFLLPHIQHKKLLVAVSGGVDSMVLVHICQTLQLDFAVAHCNFGLRGEDSIQDENFVKNYCQQHNISFFVKNFDTKKIQEGFKLNNQKISIQMLARMLRYDFFKEIMQSHSFDYLLTAHHQTDQIETILLNFLRGTGIKGMRGILPISKKNKIARLLFSFSKQEILQYAKSYELNWREDISNIENKYQRNIIRNQVLPILRQINPSLERKSAENTEKMRAVSLVWHKYLKKIRKKVCEKNTNEKLLQTLKIDIQKLQKFPNPNVILAEFLKKYGFDYAQSQEIWENREMQTGKFFENTEFVIRKEFTYFTILPKKIFLENENANTSIEIAISDEKIQIQNLLMHLKKQPIPVNFVPETHKNIATIDVAKVIFPLKIRNVQAGDYFFPLNGRGKKKLKDFITDLKLTFVEKKSMLVLCSANNDIIWVINQRMDNRFKITPKTQEMMVLEVV